MSNPTKASQYYRKKLEQHELTVEEWSAVRYAVIKHTLIAGNMTGLSIGAVIAMESGMKTVQQRLEGSGSELLYLMDRYSKATMRERLGDKSSEGVLELETSVSEPTTSTVSARMIRPQDK
ncbi:hypothetical protein BGX31_000158 [Mortierella sp. GBA43]|nr:hypothetical protein BGX31_000158 [Mortierella sp. GBA43]